MKISLCVNEATGKVAFVEAPSEFLDLLKELRFCSPLLLESLLQTSLGGDSVPCPLSTFNDDTQDHSSALTANIVSLLPQLRKLLAEVSPALLSLKGTMDLSPSHAAETESLHACSRYGSFVFAPCRTCKHSATAACLVPRVHECTLVQVKFIPSNPGQKALMRDKPIFKCTSPGCFTYSNSRLAPCSVCNEGVMGCDVLLLTDTLDGVVPANIPLLKRADIQISGKIRFHRLEKLSHKAFALSPESVSLVGAAWVSDPFSCEVDFTLPVFACSMCAKFVSNTFRAQCERCSPGSVKLECVLPCTVVLPKKDGGVGVEWHPCQSTMERTLGCKRKSQGDDCCGTLVVLDDSLGVYPGNSFLERVKLMKKKGIFNFEDLKEATISIGPREVLSLCETGHKRTCEAFFSEALGGFIP